MTNLLTKDKQLFVEGMTLYSICPDGGGDYIVITHLNVRQHGDRVESRPTHGGPGCQGRLNEWFASKDAAIQGIIDVYQSQINKYQGLADKWRQQLIEPIQKIEDRRAYDEGYDAHGLGKSQSANPHPKATSEERHWAEGWMDSSKDEWLDLDLRQYLDQ